jgi:PAS domain S-box-containing protein
MSRFAQGFTAVIVLLVAIYIGRNEVDARRTARQHIAEHASIIAKAVWALDRDSPRDYLQQAILTDRYETLRITTSEGEPFYMASGSALVTPTDHLLASLGLLPTIALRAEVRNDAQVIGTVEATARIFAVYADLYAVLIGALLILADRLYVGLLAANRDLDARVQNRTRVLRESEARFRALIENIADGIALVDAHAVVLFDSDAGGRVLGFRGGELVGRALTDLVHPDDRITTLACFAEALANAGTLTLLPELRMRHHDGHWVWVEGTAMNRLSDPSVHGVVVCYRDVTARIETREALHTSEEYYRAIVETAEEAIVMADFDLRVLLVNHKFCEITGFTKDELVGGLLDQVLFPDDRSVILDRFADRARDLREQYDFRLRRKDGSAVPVLVSVGPVRAPDGSTLGAVALMTDVSARRNLEDQLRQAQKLEAIGVLAGGVAHDFNNVLAVIISYAQLLLEGLSSADPMHDDITEIKTAAERAATLTRQLLAFSRRQVLQPRVVDLNDIVANMTRMIHRLIGEDVHLITTLFDESVPIEVDPGQIEQVLMNLAVNARDAMPSGGTLSVTVTRSEADADTAARLDLQRAPYAILAVTDTGHGMDRVTQARIFEPFFTTKAVGRGTGLGLSMAFGIVRQSGGNIDVESEPGHGTTFRIWLPFATRGALERRPAAAAPDGSGRARGTILLVEDDEHVRKLAASILSKKGYGVLEASSGGDALVLFESHASRIDLVLTDVVMPLLSGTELVRRLRSERPDLRVLFMSGYPDRHTVAVELQVGTALFLEKPFTPDSLVQRVRDALGHRPGTPPGA